MLIVAWDLVAFSSPALGSATSSADEAPLSETELCHIVWGVKGGIRSSAVPDGLEWDGTSGEKFAEIDARWHPASAAAQHELLLVCDQLEAESAPIHSEYYASLSPKCLMRALRSYVAANTSATYREWPVPEADFDAAVAELVREDSSLRSSVGFALDGRVAWLREYGRSKLAAGGGALLNQPEVMDEYVRTWKGWFEGLPLAVRAAAPQGVSQLLPEADESVLHAGFVVCRSWEALPTLQAFLAGVTRAVLLTPAFCMGAIFLFVKDIPICYSALYSVFGTILVVMGLLYLAGIAFGPIESLSFAVVVGLAVDYLVHISFAFKNSLMRERYFKSRAAFLARSSSIFAAAVTTLCAVTPLLWARIQPLRSFGLIFAIVSVISLIFALGFFNALLMIAGPGVDVIHSTAVVPLAQKPRPAALTDAGADANAEAEASTDSSSPLRKQSRGGVEADAD